MNLSRSSGILLHPTSLPGGRLGEHAYEFVDWLAAAGQSWWQVLPLGPPDDVGSSVQVGLRVRRLERPARRVRRPRSSPRNSSAFAVARVVLDRGLGSVRRRATRSPIRASRFAREWSALRELRPRQRGVRLIGDLPIYVAAGSADHVSHPLFFDRCGSWRAARRFHEGRPTLGEPALRLVGTPRGRLPLVDRALPPHVRARRPDACGPLPRLRRLWAVPADAATARSGQWRRAPGRKLFDAVRAELGDLP